jgi:hypothetical protein
VVEQLAPAPEQPTPSQTDRGQPAPTPADPTPF